MIKAPIVITTIFPPSKAISEYVKLGHHIIAIGDTRTPHSWSHKNSTFLSVEEQLKRFPKFAKQIPTKHYARKNIGYLLAIKTATECIETDDDNFPYSFFPNFLPGKISVSSFSSSTNFFNGYKYLLKGKGKIWSRGYPLRKIFEKEAIKKKKSIDSYPLQQALVDRDSDFDAIYRLTDNTLVTFKKNHKFALERHTYAPINSQNTYWQKEAFLLMYLPCFVASRVTDIYRGYMAQRLLWEINRKALFLSPSVFQERNPHDYLHDFAQEIPLYLQTENLIEALESLKLTGSLENKMIQLYAALIKNGFLIEDEMPILKTWIKEVEKLS